MTIAEFLSDLRKRDVTLWLDGDRLRCSAPKHVLDANLQAALAARKAEIISSLRAVTAQQSQVPALVPVPRTGRMPLSFGQQRLWFLQQMDPGSAVYHISDSFLLKSVDVGLLQQALTDLVRRHEILRTTIQVFNGEPYQQVGAPAPVALPYFDLRGMDPEAAGAEARRLKVEAATTPFDLARGPLFRCILIQHQTDNYEVAVTHHHIVTDGWSLALFHTEVAALYAALLTGVPAQLPELTVQYADYAYWQRQMAETAHVAQQVDYWKAKLQGLPVLELSTDRPRPGTQTFTGALQVFALSKQLSDATAALARAEGATPYMVLLTAFAVLLAKYSGQGDLAIGTSNGNRNRTELERLIGFFVNTQVLRVDIGADATLRDALSSVAAVCLEAYSNQDVTFEKLVEVLSVKRDLSRSPLFDVMFILQNTKLESLARASSSKARERAAQAAQSESAGALGFDLQVSSEGGRARVIVETGISKFDLTLYMMETNDGVRGSLEYNTDLFEHATISRMLDHYEAILEAMTTDLDRRLRNLALLTPVETKRFAAWQGSRSAYPGETVASRVQAQIAARPAAVAVGGADGVLTYQALDRRSLEIAARLRRLGIGRGDRVGVCVDRTSAMVPALLGVWYAGAAYVPLDPAFPAERLAYMVKDAAVRVVITDTVAVGAVPDGAETVLRLDVADDWRDSTAAEGHHGSPDDVAYVIYTSGSTGWPKGVEIPHRAVVNFLTSMAATPGLGVDDILLAVTTLSFDIAGLELWLPLLQGARVEIATREEVNDGQALIARLEKSGATVLQATPATWRLLLDAGWRNERGVRMLCGGEALPRDLADRLLVTGGALWNLYGPTETTIWSTVEEVLANGESITIGRPIANTQVYVLDRAGQPVPIGVLGELYLGGDGVAVGYHGRPALTAEKFVPDPFAGVLGARMYRTGDVARWLPDGRLQCLGRVDHQVKVRGFRIELGEIETALTAQPALLQAVVTVQPDLSGEQRLVAYAIPGPGAEPVVSDLRAALRERLPDYMVPSVFVFLEKFPLTPNGKIDRKALPAPDSARPRLETNFIVPRSGLEQSIASVWQEVLGLDAVGVFDNFFDLGGHSLLLVKAHSKLRDLAPRPISIVDMFRYPTIDTLARFLSEAPAADAAMHEVLARADKLKQAAARQRARNPRRGTA